MSFQIRVILASLIGFIFILISLKLGLLTELDRSILDTISIDKNDNVGWLVEAFRDLTALGSNSVLILFSIGVLVYLLIAKQYNVMSLFAIYFVAVIICSTLLKHAVDRPRPIADERAAMVFTKSFPSAHAMHSSAILLAIAIIFCLYAQTKHQYRVAVAMMAIVTTIIIGITRLSLAVHWPSDVLAGWLLGTAFAGVFYCIAHHQLQSKNS